MGQGPRGKIDVGICFAIGRLRALMNHRGSFDFRVDAMRSAVQKRLTKKQTPKPIPTNPIFLEDGQLWQLADCQLSIIRVGKFLVHFKQSRHQNQRGIQVQMQNAETVSGLIRTKRGKLLSAGKKPNGSAPLSFSNG
jgi:hypothetical protein